MLHEVHLKVRYFVVSYRFWCHKNDSTVHLHSLLLTKDFWMLRRARSFYHMMGFIVSCTCQRINDLGMIILCLKGQNSHKCKRPWSSVLSHLLSLMISVFWAKRIATLPHLTASLVLILLLPAGRWGGANCRASAELLGYVAQSSWT